MGDFAGMPESLAKREQFSGAQMHELKCDPQPFKDVWGTRKTFEVRKDDRGFCCNDVLLLREHDQVTERYSGRALLVLVTHMLRGGAYGVAEGHVCMSIKVLARLGAGDA